MHPAVARLVHETIKEREAMGRKPAGEQPLPRQGRTVNGTDDRLWLRLRAMAILEGKTTGEALNEAIREWLEKRGAN